MPRVSPVVRVAFFTALCVSLLAMRGVAGTITYSGYALDLGAMGYGNVPPIMSVSGIGNATSEWGKVSWDGSDDVLAGGAGPQGCETRPVSSLLAEGVTKDAFGLVLNINEASDRDITIHAFSLEVYPATGGASILSIPLVGGPLTLSSAGRGQGQAGYLFWVHLTDTEWNNHFAGATTNRLGMDIPSDPLLHIQNVSDGAESFTVSIPEPATLGLLALGGLAMLGLRRRRR